MLRKFRLVILVLFGGMTLVSFQNCSKMTAADFQSAAQQSASPNPSPAPAPSPSPSPSPAPGVFNWKTLKVGAGGFIRGIEAVIDPGSSPATETIVIHTDTYGAYLWKGNQWQQLVTTLSMPANFVNLGMASGVYEIQAAPTNTNILYMMYLGFVFKSTNKGSTWIQTSFAQVSDGANGCCAQFGQKIAIDPINANVVYVGSPDKGLFVTNDGGSTWTKVTSVPVSTTAVTGILFDPVIGGSANGKTKTIFASSAGNGVYESLDAGATWTQLSGSPSTVYNAAVSSTGVYYAIDGTSVWSFNNGAWKSLLNNGGNGLQAVAVNPSNANEVVITSPAGYTSVSFDAGATWLGSWSSNLVDSTDISWLKSANESSGGNFLDIGVMTFDPLIPNRLLASAGTGVWTTTMPTTFKMDDSLTWTDQSLGIEQLVANSIIVPPGGKPVLASWDRPFFYINNPDAFPATYGPVNSVNIDAGWSVDYASTDPTFIAGLISNGKSVYSTNGGQTWSNFASNPTFPPQANGGSIAASSPQNIILAPANGVQPYYTLNGGTNWNPITLPGITDWSSFEGSSYLNERSVVADRVSSNTFYLLYPGHGIYKSTNGGASWTQVFSGDVIPFDWYNNELMSVPGKAGHLFFTAGPQGGQSLSNPGNQSFMRSIDGGTTWTAVPKVMGVYCFGFGAPKVANGYPAIFIVGFVNNVYGIWQSDDNAATWTQIGTWPLNSLDVIKTIAGDPNNYGKAYVGFSGSGYAYYGQ